MMRAFIPPGSWPFWMDARTAAGFCGEKSVRDFRRSVGKVYPKPWSITHKGEMWLRDELEQAMREAAGGPVSDAADVL